MNEIKIEVGQVWGHTAEDYQIEILKGYTDIDGQHRFAVLCTWCNGSITAHSQSDEYLHEDYTLIKNADGSDVKQYRDINVWEAMRLLGEAREPIAVQVRYCDADEWVDEILIGAQADRAYQFITGDNAWKQCRIEVK